MLYSVADAALPPYSLKCSQALHVKARKLKLVEIVERLKRTNDITEYMFFKDPYLPLKRNIIECDKHLPNKIRLISHPHKVQQNIVV